MNEELKAKWITALRSGNYKQGVGRLRGDDKFCCLGVLCDLVVPEDWDGPEQLSTWALPPSYVIEPCGLSDATCAELACKNDDGESFEEIADYIEKNV